MFNAIVKANTKEFMAGGAPASPDRNGQMPIQFNVLYGTFPNRALTLSGTVAERQGILANKVYNVQATRLEDNEYGPQFQVSVISEISGIDLVLNAKTLTDNLGEGKVITVDAPVQETEDVTADAEANSVFEEETA